MGISIRHYLFPEGSEPERLSQRLVDGLVSGGDSLRQYAGTRQRVLSVVLENEDGEPGKIIRTEGSIWEFDQDGKIRRGLQDAFAEVMNSLPTPESEDQTVVHLRPRLSKKRLEKEYRWEPGTPEINRVINDIWPKSKDSRLKAAKGSAPKRPPLTFDAKHALGEASEPFFKVYYAIERLKEPSLAGFAFEARHRSEADPDFPFLYAALADMAEERLKILRRRRSGKGTWYAQVEITRWNDGIGEQLAEFHEQCEGRNAAINAARRLLAEHARHLTEDITVEASVVTDLEWRE